jgi:hypothetical protein
MNYSTSVFLINPKVRAIACIYEPDTEARKHPRTVFKTLDQLISVDDFVVVPTETRHRMTVNRVVEVDVDPDLESTCPMAWIITSIDRNAYERVLAEEGRAIKLMKDAEKTHQREELRSKLMAHVDQDALNRLGITSMTDAPAIEPS